ncbi:hypothetical protein ColLi_12922 [Colletotrichum liriopes]|uniref:Uncharacterized protein n=1 Tax=Colletotrichum liriopes TaxID=708192 RepID=A0AA37LZ68_9PEZI|nr:hypothetical protein ColLi_12922 [Colletotrichum liriopes]
MASQLSSKDSKTKLTMAAKVDTCVQGNARVHKISAPAEKKNELPQTATKAENQTEEGKKANDEPATLLRFGTKLPREIIAMIFEEVTDYDPAIAYVHCKMGKGSPRSLVLSTGEKGQKSKFKELVRLAKLLPEFQTIVERRFGHPFNGDLAKNPRLGIRKEKDLAVFVFEKTAERFFSWTLGSQSILNRATLAPGIRDVGIRYNNADCMGLNCYGCVACVKNIARQHFCALELACFCQNLSHVNNIFILVRLEGSDVVGTVRSEHEKLMKALIGMFARLRGYESAFDVRLTDLDPLVDAKRIRHHVSFEDAERTWVEVSCGTPRANRRLIRPGLLAPIFVLCATARSVNTDQALRMVGGQDRRHVRFRVLVGSRWRDATLGI